MGAGRRRGFGKGRGPVVQRSGGAFELFESGLSQSAISGQAMLQGNVETGTWFVEKVEEGGEVSCGGGESGVGVQVSGRGEVLLGLFRQ